MKPLDPGEEIGLGLLACAFNATLYCFSFLLPEGPAALLLPLPLPLLRCVCGPGLLGT